MKLKSISKIFIISLIFFVSSISVSMAADWNKPTLLINLSGDEYFPTFSPDGTKLAFVEYHYTDNKTISDGVFMLNFETKKQKIILTPDELFKVCSSTGVTEFSSMEVWRLSWNPDGKKILFSAYCRIPNGDKVVRFGLIDITTMKVNDFKPGEHPSWSPDGEKIVYLYKHGPTVAGCQRCGKELWLMNADGSDDHMIYNVYGNQSLSKVPQCQIIVNDTIVWPSFSSDGKKILFGVYHSTDNSSINLISVEGKGFKELISGSRYSNPQFTPDEKEIVFFKSKDDDAEIWSMSIDGSNQKKIPTISGLKLNGLSISPDGKKLVFPMSNGKSGFDIWIMTKEAAVETKTPENKISIYIILLIIVVAIIFVVLIQRFLSKRHKKRF